MTVEGRPYLAILLLFTISKTIPFHLLYAQNSKASDQTQNHGRQLSFEIVSIKPIPTGVSTRHTGFRSLPGGRVDIIGIGIRQLMALAFHIPASQIKGGPDWLDTVDYSVQAIPSDNSPSRKLLVESSTPTDEQRTMLKALLSDRFALQYRTEMHSGSGYVLTKGSGQVKMDAPQNTDRKPAFAIFMRGDVFDGEARGANVSMLLLAQELSFNLNSPVIDKTGLSGAYDFHVEPFAPENKDVDFAATAAMDRLGLKLVKQVISTENIVIESITRPTPN